LTGRAVYSVEPLTPVRCCALDARLLPDLVRNHPELCMALMRAWAEAEQRSDARTAVLGTGTAAQRLAYFLLEIFDQLQARGMADATMCPFPLRRHHLAEIIGLSEVHVSRTLATLRREGVIQLMSNVLVILDHAALRGAAGNPPPPRVEKRVLL
jgi:CRP-like cAMP-binding protein